MLSRIFPTRFDNSYRGYTIAIWLLGPLVLAKLLMGANVMLNTHAVIVGADRIPLDHYGPDAASTVTFLFQTWGLVLALFSLLGLLAIARYRSMVPLIYLLLLVENAGRKLFGVINPVHVLTDGQTMSLGFMINTGFIAALLIGFALSIGPADDPANAR
ncbi:MAG: hypothetical protein ABL973_14490 [Micropepsaceae bacterium]